MNEIIASEDRRFVVITDPHISVDESFAVFSNGLKKDMRKDEDNNLISIFVKEIKDGHEAIFSGHCWPG